MYTEAVGLPPVPVFCVSAFAFSGGSTTVSAVVAPIKGIGPNPCAGSAYTPVSNFAVGAYEFGAGFTRTQGDFLSNGYAALFSSNAGDPKQTLYRHLGYDAAAKGDASCSQTW
jgi:hypothetical protein